MILTLTPNPAIDRTLEVRSLATGAVNRAVTSHVEPSGKGVNVTRALAANDIRSQAILPIGGVEGAQLRQLLDDESVSFVGVPISDPIRVNISVAAPGGVVTKINEPGPTLTWAEGEALVESVLTHLGRTDWVVASGSLPRGISADFYAELAERVHHAGGHLALDTSGAALRRGMEGQPDLVKPNLEELAELAGEPLPTIDAVLTAATKVSQTTGGSVLVSLGAAGAVLVGAGSPLHAEATGRVPVRSTVGAGDNLLAGYLAAQGEPSQRLREAVAWGSAAVRSTRSLARPVTDGDRRTVVLHPAPDPRRPL
ncbi:hexose kinase [Actinopolymorpha pittospori]|uniref:hexose kinase n=1 Tax=Actinopolymorpha pittospori TaxID=648752 RepID=UPI00178A2BA3